MSTETVPTLSDHIRAGLRLFTGGDVASAVRHFQFATEMAPELTLAWNNLAMAEVARGAVEAGIFALNRSLALDIAQPQCWIALASAYLKLEQWSAAERAARQAVAQAPRHSEAWQTLGLILGQIRHFAEAADCLGCALTLQPPEPVLLTNYGNMLFQCGRYEEAAGALQQAALLDPAQDARLGMADLSRFVAMMAAGDTEKAFAFYDQKPPAEALDRRSAYRMAFLSLGKSGHTQAARAVATGWAVRLPDDTEAAYMVQTGGGKPLDRTPAAFVAEHFDAYADRFETHLVQQLGYDVPALIAAKLAEAGIGKEGGLDVLDIGCGTGLCGPHLRPLARRLTGVDLAAKMVNKARARGFYDVLEVGELLDHLQNAPQAYDLIVAADVLIYFGDLPPVFAATAAALRPGGYFIFSVENGTAEKPYSLQASGRFAHSGQAIRDWASPLFAALQFSDIIVRHEGGAPIPGSLILARKVA